MTGRRLSATASCHGELFAFTFGDCHEHPPDLRCDVDKPRAPLPLRGRLPKSAPLLLCLWPLKDTSKSPGYVTRAHANVSQSYLAFLTANATTQLQSQTHDHQHLALHHHCTLHCDFD